MRARFPGMAMLAGPPEPVAHVEEAVASSPRGTVPVRIYRPQTRSRAPLLVWFHGGGFVVGDIDTYDSPMRALANRCGCTVVSVAYRLAPEHPYPAGIEDAYTALHWAAANARTLGADPEAIVAAMLARERCGPEVFMQVLLYPDGDARAGFNHASWRHYDGCVLERLVKDRQLAMYLPVSVDRTHPHVSPALSIPEYLRGMPSALIVTGEFDPQRDEGEQYAMRLRDAGIATSLTRNPGMIHGFFQMAEKFDAGKKVIGQVAAAIRAKSTGVGFSEF